MRKLFNTLHFIAFIMLFLFAVISCESPSRKFANEPNTKVVVIDGLKNPTTTVTGVTTLYKVRVLVTNTVGYVPSMYKYEAGDTIMTKKSLIRY